MLYGNSENHVLIHYEKRDGHLTGSIQKESTVVKYSSAFVSTSNTLQDLSRLCETADNTERYINGIFV
jgi:hypothetical protein